MAGMNNDFQKEAVAMAEKANKGDLKGLCYSIHPGVDEIFMGR